MVRLKQNNMNSNFSKPTILTAKHYDKTITVEIDHSDIDINEVMDMVETLIIGMGFRKDALRDWVKETADIYNEEDSEDDFKYPEPNEALKKAFQHYVANLPTEVVYDDYGQRTNDKK